MGKKTRGEKVRVVGGYEPKKLGGKFWASFLKEYLADGWGN